jgi:hypothetical protein
MDNLVAYGNVGLAINKINQAMTKLKEVEVMPEYADECKRLNAQLIDVIKYLFILQDTVNGDV